MKTRTRTISRLEVVPMPDGTLDRVRVRYLQHYVMAGGKARVLEEIPIEVFVEADLNAQPVVRRAKDQKGNPSTAKRRRRKPRKAAPVNVVGMVSLKPADLEGVSK